MEGVSGFHPCFAERRMRVNGLAEFGSGKLGADGRRRSGDQLRGVRTDRGCTEQLIGCSVGDPFDEADRFVNCHGAAQTAEAKLAGLDGAVLFLRVFLGDAHQRDFG